MAALTVSTLSVRRVTPAQRALALPEVLSNIFSQNALDTQPLIHSKSQTRDLLNFALVNKTWYNEAIRVLWDHPTGQIDQVMASIPADRRQYYANFIHWIFLLCRPGEDKRFKSGGSLHGLRFPRLDRLSVSLYTNRLYVIPFAHPQRWVKEMYFKKRAPKYDDETDFDGVLEIVETFFPSIGELYLRYEGPDSHLSGLITIPKSGRVVPARNTHWYIDRAPVEEEEDGSYGYQGPGVVSSSDTWGETNWTESYLTITTQGPFNWPSNDVVGTNGI
ncbi:hypothetical protein N7541_001458 [Penicillium brevicompactum]|uniref:F-box domain-containing protein n=1 Tax=Penicillium brevicompactum TaxID=5074 RepID=A0A9W9RWE1_PENBR|nr:uncharacterized protein N7506_000880 [Penicillium brevicompactum]KAJ5347627.1 hypothetical protein N7506_000880 [Penicillium brevicompactum]KAJ5367517.1 hypothetical protein N7541_001458 [Penicillium brevicompactum]